ncbi:MAG: DUF5752 family protein [Aquificota bacterium]|nr:DUF5752 family protein [Aquificota bacterium]MDQ7081573.1 DUF5752 family protein [Aquificota bacterium]
MPEFRFRSELWTAQYTGVKVSTLGAFLKALREVDDDTVYYHLYRNMFEYHFLPTDYWNSFSYWFAENGFPVLAEKFSALDLIECVCLSDIREEMVRILEREGHSFDKICKPFYFIRAVRRTVDLGVVARDLSEFKEGVKKVGIHSLFYHLVTSRLVHCSPVNDFSRWLTEIGEERKAREINRIDLISYSLYDLRNRIIDILES